ncbi:MAG: Microtubule-associated protein RP/EB member 2 [Marteilia pararefringens]
MAESRSYEAINVSTTNYNCRNISRYEALNWVNHESDDAANRRYETVEQLCDGVGYCVIMEKTFPKCLNLKKVKRNANQEVQKIDNLKILQSGFNSCKIDKQVPINLLVKGKYMDNFEFVLWFYKFIKINSKNSASTTLKAANKVKEGKHQTNVPFKPVRSGDFISSEENASDSNRLQDL